jgi:CDP-diacylglycerol--serine O-phosphatidyltransferase
VQYLLINKWLLYAVIVILGWLMTSNIRFMALKFRDLSLKNNGITYLLLGLSVVAVILLKWLAVPVIFILYILLSFFVKKPAEVQRETLDVTV